jgi:hypothetical protein
LNGSAQAPADDAPVPDRTPLYRLVPTNQCEAREGQWIFHGGAFDNTSDTDDMSVVLDDTLRALQRAPDDLPERTFPDPDRWGVAVIHDAGYLRDDEEQEIRRTPRTEEPPEPAHGDVRGKKNKTRRRRIKQRAEWVRHPAAPAEG